MGYDHGESFSFDFEPNRIPFGSKSKGKLSPRSYPIQFERNWKYSFLSAIADTPELNGGLLFGAQAALLIDDNRIKMVRKPGKKRKKNPVWCTGEGRR